MNSKDTSFDHQFKLLSNEIINQFKDGNPILIGVIISLFVVLVTILYVTLLQKRGKRYILLVGLCDSGKTLLFFQLLYKKSPDTQTSITENTGVLATGGKSGVLHVADLPGHEKVRWQKFDQYKEQARAVIFVVDSSTIQRDLKDVAEYLYTILTEPAIMKNGVKVLIACNKTDMTLAKGSQVIRSLLEKEINLLRTTKSAALSGTHDSGSAKTTLGRKGKDFEFNDLRLTRVEFVECSAKDTNNSKPQLDDINKWLEKV